MGEWWGSKRTWDWKYCFGHFRKMQFATVHPLTTIIHSSSHMHNSLTLPQESLKYYTIKAAAPGSKFRISWSKSTSSRNEWYFLCIVPWAQLHGDLWSFDLKTYTQSSYLPWTYLKYNAKIIAIDTPFKKGEIRTKLSLAHSNTKTVLGHMLPVLSLWLSHCT